MRDVAERLLNVATLGSDIVERLISLDYLRFHGTAPDFEPVIPQFQANHIAIRREVRSDWNIHNNLGHVRRLLICSA